jgi:hypothetical protein
MTSPVAREIQALVDLETEGWNTKNPERRASRRKR